MKQQLPDDGNNVTLNLEIVKAAAQAWLAHSSNPKSETREFNMYKDSFMRRPSRFKLEAMKLSKLREREAAAVCNFSHSLWDPLEIVRVSKRLEVGLLLDHATPAVYFASKAEAKPAGGSKKGRKGSLKKLLHKSFSRRVNSG